MAGDSVGTYSFQDCVGQNQRMSGLISQRWKSGRSLLESLGQPVTATPSRRVVVLAEGFSSGTKLMASRKQQDADFLISGSLYIHSLVLQEIM